MNMKVSNGFREAQARRPLEKVNKLRIFFNCVFLWLVLYVVVLFAWLIYDYFFLRYYINIPVFSTVTRIFLLTYALMLLAHHVLAQYNYRKGSMFSSMSGDNILVRIMHPSGVRRGTFVGVRLFYYVKRVGRHEWIDKIVDYVLTQKITHERPLILRSHLLSSPSMCERITSRIEAHGLKCSVSKDLPMQAKFKLLWLTPANIAAYQFYLPTLNARETEIVITPA